MANNDWDLDDLLNFSYDREVPEKNDDFDIFDQFDKMSAKDKPRAEKPESGKGLGESFSDYDELKMYEKLRCSNEHSNSAFDVPKSAERPHRDRPQHDSPKHMAASEDPLPPLLSERENRFAQGGFDRDIFEQYEKMPKAAPVVEEVHKAPVEELADAVSSRSAKEIEALKQASHDAYERYRSNYIKGKKKRSGNKGWKVGKFHRVLTAIYLISFAVFVVSMVFMNVLPFGLSLVLYGLLVLISLFVFVQTRRTAAGKWAKRFATLIAVILIGIYGVGTVYALGTLSFLSDSSVSNEKAVSDITRKPFNFVITGIDVDGTIDEQGRSDVNMVVTVNPSTHQILMTSIPRDYEIYMAEFDNAMDKLTHTGFYGVSTTIAAEEQLFDTTVNYYVKVNFTTVERFIDAVGGVDVESEYEFTPVKLKDWTVQEGMNHMNGKQALAFARERKAFLTGDNQRIKNQQAVFEALIRKATGSRTMILSYNKVLTSLRNYFEMSFSSREIRRLVKLQIARNPDWHIYKNTVVGGDGSMPTYSTGGAYAYVMTQDQESIDNAKALITAVMEGQTLQTDDDGKVSIAKE